MGKVVAEIVLTGGPGAGKTSALAKLEQDLIAYGYNVFIAPESATEIINTIRPFGPNKISDYNLQEIIMNDQIHKRNQRLYAASKVGSDKCIIIYDRAIPDDAAYVSKDKYTMICKENGLTELEVMAQYGLVVHMVTPAYDKRESYTTLNNTARSESVELACERDEATLKSYLLHPNLKVVGNETDFEEKLNNVANHVFNYLGLPTRIKEQRKFLTDLKNTDLKWLKETSTKIKLIQSYIYGDYIRRLRQMLLGSESLYYETKQGYSSGNIKVYSEQNITAKAYENALNENESWTTQKDRYTFVLGKMPCNLDIYDGNTLGIIEVPGKASDGKINFPNSIKILDEVTLDSTYKDANLARTLKI